MPRIAQRTAANVASIPAPVGGWNVRDSLANMSPTDAVTMTNFFPTVSSVNLRGGYTKWSTGISGQVETLMAYETGSVSKLFGVAGGSIYNCTTQGAVGAAERTGLTNSRFEHINVTTAGGSFLYACNGVDDPLLYNGTTWSSINGSSSPIAITGITTNKFNNVTLFKNRVWFIEKESLKAWYLPTNSVGGAAEVLDLSSIARMGGYIVSLSAWTIDAGYGVDDNLVFVTSQGEIIVYRGTDPSSASTWALAGVWKLGAPVSKRCLYKYGGDLLVLSLDGLLPLASALQSSRLDPRVNLSDKIQGAITEVTTAYQNSFGWALLYHAKNNALWINVPVSVGAQEQFVMNTITKSWTRFTGWNANCWETFNDNPYFGGNGYVALAWDGYTDDINDINAVSLQAFNYYDNRGVKKYFTRARPSIFTDGSPAIVVGINVDFDLSDTTGSLNFSPTTYGFWDTSVWDTGLWAANTIITNNWQGVTGIGYCAGIQLKSASQGLQIEWASTDVVFQQGWAGI
jgi:hypothetical protein